MTAAQEQVVMAMRKLKLGHRDAGRLLGLSHQRVQQLEQMHARRNREPARPVRGKKSRQHDATDQR